MTSLGSHQPGLRATRLLGLRRKPGRLALALFRLPLPLYRHGWDLVRFAPSSGSQACPIGVWKPGLVERDLLCRAVRSRAVGLDGVFGPQAC